MTRDIFTLGHIQLGTVGDWFSGSIALVALGFTMFVWRRDVHAARNEDRKREAREVIENASKVSCWVSISREAGAVGARNAVLLRNDTSGPIYNWEARLFIDPPAREFIYSSAEFGQIGPSGQRLEIPLHDSDDTYIRRSEIEFTYRLADGAQWQRLKSGELVNVSESLPVQTIREVPEPAMRSASYE